jgi:hypothetical protein
MNNLFSSKPALAGPESENKGRYQTSAWGVQAQNADPTSGYYMKGHEDLLREATRWKKRY